jgi:uncharacterized protein (DUF983 family)
VLTEKTGLRCPTCTQKLVVLQAGIIVAGVVIFFCGITTIAGASIWLSAKLHRELSAGEFTLVLLPLALLIAIAHFRISPLFARVRLVSRGEAVHFPRLT